MLGSSIPFTVVFLYPGKHHSIKMYWGMEVKFPLSRRLDKAEHRHVCGGKKTESGHPSMFKIFAGSIFCDQHKQATVFTAGGGGFIIAMSYGSFIGRD
jgi:hypothetical protein